MNKILLKEPTHFQVNVQVHAQVKTDAKFRKYFPHLARAFVFVAICWGSGLLWSTSAEALTDEELRTQIDAQINDIRARVSQLDESLAIEIAPFNKNASVAESMSQLQTAMTKFDEAITKYDGKTTVADSQFSARTTDDQAQIELNKARFRLGDSNLDANAASAGLKKRIVALNGPGYTPPTTLTELIKEYDTLKSAKDNELQTQHNTNFTTLGQKAADLKTKESTLRTADLEQKAAVAQHALAADRKNTPTLSTAEGTAAHAQFETTKTQMEAKDAALARAQQAHTDALTAAHASSQAALTSLNARADLRMPPPPGTGTTPTGPGAGAAAGTPPAPGPDDENPDAPGTRRSKNRNRASNDDPSNETNDNPTETNTHTGYDRSSYAVGQGPCAYSDRIDTGTEKSHYGCGGLDSTVTNAQMTNQMTMMLGGLATQTSGAAIMGTAGQSGNQKELMEDTAYMTLGTSSLNAALGVVNFGFALKMMAGASSMRKAARELGAAQKAKIDAGAEANKGASVGNPNVNPVQITNSDDCKNSDPEHHVAGCATSHDNQAAKDIIQAYSLNDAKETGATLNPNASPATFQKQLEDQEKFVKHEVGAIARTAAGEEMAVANHASAAGMMSLMTSFQQAASGALGITQGMLQLKAAANLHTYMPPPIAPPTAPSIGGNANGAVNPTAITGDGTQGSAGASADPNANTPLGLGGPINPVPTASDPPGNLTPGSFVPQGPSANAPNAAPLNLGGESTQAAQEPQSDPGAQAAPQNVAGALYDGPGNMTAGRGNGPGAEGGDNLNPLAAMLAAAMKKEEPKQQTDIRDFAGNQNMANVPYTPIDRNGNLFLQISNRLHHSVQIGLVGG